MSCRQLTTQIICSPGQQMYAVHNRRRPGGDCFFSVIPALGKSAAAAGMEELEAAPGLEAEAPEQINPAAAKRARDGDAVERGRENIRRVRLAG